MPFSSPVVDLPVRDAVKPPRRYQVVIFNDDVTPFAYVILVLMKIFDFPEDRAFSLTQDVHHRGEGVCGEYPLEIAEILVSEVASMNAEFGLALVCRHRLIP